MRGAEGRELLRLAVGDGRTADAAPAALARPVAPSEGARFPDLEAGATREPNVDADPGPVERDATVDVRGGTIVERVAPSAAGDLEARAAVEVERGEDLCVRRRRLPAHVR